MASQTQAGKTRSPTNMSNSGSGSFGPLPVSFTAANKLQRRRFHSNLQFCLLSHQNVAEGAIGGRKSDRCSLGHYPQDGSPFTKRLYDGGRYVGSSAKGCAWRSLFFRAFRWNTS